MRLRKPEWLRTKLQGGESSNKVNALIEKLELNTVCDGANCPNRMECFERGTATFMILGNHCTRNCRFCNVTCAKPEPVDPEEPKKLAQAVKTLGLKHAVVTSVTRDDLEDQGANQFRKVVEEIRKVDPNISIELLIPDMQGREDLIDIIIDAEPEILNHNIETIPELYDTVRPQAIFQRSLDVLDYVKKRKPHMITKSGMMLGLGETEEQVIETMKKLREVDCDIFTLGQYLQPTTAHLDVVEYITPEQFKRYEEIGKELGFRRVVSGPLVRSSYYADDFQ